MNLGISICDLADTIKNSKSLCGVHLSDNNNFTHEVLYYIGTKLKIPFRQRTKINE